MGIKQYKPTSAGRRGGSVSDFADCTYPRENRPEKSLLSPLPKKGGRNHHGIITSRFRGGLAASEASSVRVVVLPLAEDGVAHSIGRPGRFRRAGIVPDPRVSMAA